MASTVNVYPSSTNSRISTQSPGMTKESMSYTSESTTINTGMSMNGYGNSSYNGGYGNGDGYGNGGNNNGGNGGYNNGGNNGYGNNGYNNCYGNNY